MDEPTAWLFQALADRQAGEQLVDVAVETGWCHAVAKWQQTVEKAVKAMVAALHDAGALGAGPRPRHDVERYVGVLIRLPRTAANRTIQHQLHGLLDQNTRASIRALDGLAPQLPPWRNTEYPFQDAQGRWTYAAAQDVFSQVEVQQFRALAHRIVEGAERIVSAIRRRPR